jgi:hypothetical protein
MGNKSSAPAYPKAEINRLADQYVRDQQADVGPYLKAISNFGDRLTKKVDDLVEKGATKLDAEETALLGRLDDFNQRLVEFQATENTELLKDLGDITGDFRSAMSLLDETDRKEFSTALKNFEERGAELVKTYDARATAESERGFTDSQSVLDKYEEERKADIAKTKGEELSTITKYGTDSKSLADEFQRSADGFLKSSLDEADQRAKDSKDITGRFDSETKALTDELRKDSLSNIERNTTERKSLADTFLSMSGTSTSDYNRRLEEALSLSPERLAEFTQAADFISKAALQTRMDMLATADPRALELSAIADENAAALMSGRISADVQANLARSSAMRALQGGFGAGSEMGRGLSARDLGLTSLDLMKQGSELNDAQRRLNYATRVEGVARDAGANAGQFLANDQTLRRNQAADLLSAETDRNRTFFDVSERGLANELAERNRAALNYADQSRMSLTDRQRAELDQLNKVGDTRQAAFLQGRQDARGVFDYLGRSQDLMLGSNLAAIRYGAERTDNTLNTALAGNLANINTRTTQNLGIARDVFAGESDINRLGFAAGQDNLAQRTRRQADNLTNIWDRDFQARLGVYNTNVGTGRSLYGTNVQAAGNIYNTSAGFIQNMTGNQINTAGNVYQGDTRARENAFNTMAQVRGSAMGTKINAAQKGWEVDQANWASGKNSDNAMWGSLVNMGATIAGGVIGTAAGGNTMAGLQIGSTLGGIASSGISGGSGSGGGSGSSGGGNPFSTMGMFTSALGGMGKTTGFDNQWGMYGRNTKGFGNFDYGSGTGA